MKLDNTKLAIAVAAALSLGLAACGEKQPESSPDKFGQNLQQPAPGAPQPGERVAGVPTDDGALREKVQSALTAEPDLKAGQITVDATAGVVTLRGTTDSPEKKQKAEQLASTIEGVRSVKNELIVVRG